MIPDRLLDHTIWHLKSKALILSSQHFEIVHVYLAIPVKIQKKYINVVDLYNMEKLCPICSIIKAVTYFIGDIVPKPVKGQDTQQSEGKVCQPHLVNGVQLKHRATCYTGN